MLPASKFQVIPQSELSERHFEEWPVWSEHYDYDEIEDIESWGLDRDEVLQAFERNAPGNEHCVYTLGSSAATLFPMKYQTEFRDSNGEIIAGSFQYGQRQNTAAVNVRPQ